MKLFVVVPCFNEIGNISQVVEAVKPSSVKDCEIIIVDYCSTYGARELLKYKIESPINKVIYHKKNRAKGAALRFEKHGKLKELLDCLQNQVYEDFEIIIVAQSRTLWELIKKYSELDILYIHTDIKGSVIARNTAAFYAMGEVLAFTDDDCQPKPDWLENSIKYFDNKQVVGVEGLIVSDKLEDNNYRPVTNVGFEGIGFMTANLLLKREVFMAVDGFDESFDNPHFREDTDLAWRICNYGKIPFAYDVCVFHPPHLRTDSRESLEERGSFFEKDALLMKKHPERYRELFLRESHYRKTPGFRENLFRGAIKYNTEIDSFYLQILGV